jgi:hypothetical protein
MEKLHTRTVNEIRRLTPKMIWPPGLRRATVRVLLPLASNRAFTPHSHSVQPGETALPAQGYETIEHVTSSSPRSSQGDDDLPEFCGKPRVTLLAMNSYLIHVYWDFDAATLSDPIPPATLRFHDVTEGSSGSGFDVAVDLPARSWYVPVWSPARSYYVELGWKEEGRFRPIAKSNTVETPRAWPVIEVEPPLARAQPTPAPGESSAGEDWSRSGSTAPTTRRDS